jgi:hypothetical protein
MKMNLSVFIIGCMGVATVSTLFTDGSITAFWVQIAVSITGNILPITRSGFLYRGQQFAKKI